MAPLSTAPAAGPVPPGVLAVVPEALAAEFFDAGARARLAARGTLFVPGLDEVPDAVELGAVRVLVTSWGVGPLGPAELDRLPGLELIVHTGASVKHFTTEECFARGIRISQAGAAMARPVAEVSLAFSLALLHQISRFDHDLRAGGDWEPRSRRQREILGAQIGVVGASRTGTAYLELIRALGARPLLSDPTIGAARAAELGAELVPLDELLRRSQIVALHAPTLPETHHLIGARELALMADGAGLVNTARSWLVDEAALLSELRSGRLDAALDVFDEEPLPARSEFRTLPNVLCTPHRAAGTVEGRLRGGRIVVDEVDALFEGRPLRHTVERADLDRMA